MNEQVRIDPNNPAAALIKASPNIFEYDNYRTFLKDYYAHRKITDRKFSLRFLCARLGYSSPGFIKFIMDGKRNLTADGIARFSKALGMSPEQAGFFRQLVLFNQADSAEDKQNYADQLVRSKAFKEKRPLDQSKFRYWSKWYNVAIREMVAVDGFQEDPHWIASALIPAITPEQAKESLKDLLSLGLIRRNAEGKLELAESDLRTGDQVLITSVKEFHREMALRAKESIDRFKADRRHVSCLTFSLSEEGEKQIRAMIEAFQHEVIAVAERHQERCRVVQVNFNLFPLSKEIVK